MMLIVVAILIFTLIFALAALLVWGVLWVFRVRGVGRRIFKWAGIALLAFLPIFFFGITPLWMSWFVASQGTRPFDLDFEETPQSLGCPYEETRFRAADGLEISGWFLPGDPAFLPMTIGHGLFRNRHEVLRRACDFNKAGYPVLIFDFRNHRSKRGESGRKTITLGFQERLDLIGAVDELSRRLPGRPVVLMGVSMGAAAAIQAAAESPDRIAAVVADSPFLSLDETVRRHIKLFLGLPAFPVADVFIWNIGRLGNFDPDRLDTVEALKSIPQIPVLLIYGEQDDRIPRRIAEEVFTAASPRSRLVFFEGAGHGRAYLSDPTRYIQTVIEFLQQSDSRP